MESVWQVLKRNLQAGVFTAADKAEAMARLGRARLDISATKTRVRRAEADLGRAVFVLAEAGDTTVLGEQTAINALCDDLRELKAVLAQRLQTLADLERAYSTEAQPPVEHLPTDGEVVDEMPPLS